MFDLEHHENLIKRLLGRLDELFTFIYTPGMFMSEEELERDFRAVAKKAYISICAYIEGKGLHSYLKDFKEDLLPALSDDKQLFESTEFDDALGQSFSVLVDRFHAYLSIFFAFGDISFIHQRPGLRYLEHILQSTPTILDKMDIVPGSEAQIYNAVKFVCEVTFPSRILDRLFHQEGKVL